jgi:hypothetical protein
LKAAVKSETLVAMSPAVKLAMLAIFILLVAWGAYRASRNGSGSEFVASGLILLLGIFVPVVKPPQQTLEETREEKGRVGGASGDPPEP